MPADTSGCDEDGFAFTDEDFARRYATKEQIPGVPSSDGLATASPISSNPGPRPIHGGGNSFMRARRRRSAARGL